MSSWRPVRLKNLCVDSGQYGLGVSAESYVQEGVRLLRTTDISSGVLTPAESGVFVESIPDSRFVLKEGDLILSRSGTPPGQSYLIQATDNQMTFAGYLVRFRPRPDTEPRFLAYVARSARFQQTIMAESVAATIQNFNAERYANMRFVAPDSKEQCRIADFLDAETARIDALAAKRQNIRELIELKRERVIDAILGLESANTRHDLVPLKYLVDAVSVGIVITPAKWYVESGGTQALRGLNIKPGSIDTSDLVRISDAGHAENSKSRLRSGDVVVVRTGQAGAAAVVPASLDGANCIDLIIVRPGKIVSKYLEYVLNSAYAQRQVSEYAVGSIQAHFNIGAMKQIPIPVISAAEQRNLVDQLDRRVHTIDELSRALVNQESLLAERRQALITAAVTGQFDVSSASGRGVTEGVSV